jgi:hypothetical protein
MADSKHGNLGSIWSFGASTDSAGLSRLSTSIRVARKLSLHATCVVAYRRHRDCDGACALCGQFSPCSVRRRAITVIEAHADDPRRYDEVDGEQVRMVAGVAAAPRVAWIG